MLPRLTKAIVIFVLTLSLGAHWALLQSVAWTGMLLTYTKQAGFVRAVTMTFDGEHPCALCKTIQQGKAQERQEKQHNLKPATELKVDLPPVPFIFVHPPQPRLACSPNTLVTSLARAPELPPPRST